MARICKFLRAVRCFHLRSCAVTRRQYKSSGYGSCRITRITMGAEQSKAKSQITPSAPRSLGANSTEPSPNEDPRSAAARAAEQRQKQAEARGTNAANPKQGQLAAKVNKTPSAEAPGNEQRLVWE